MPAAEVVFPLWSPDRDGENPYVSIPDKNVTPSRPKAEAVG
jgi:hypothetical protein